MCNTSYFFQFQKHHVNLLHIESRPSKQSEDDYDFFVACDNEQGGLKEVIEELKTSTKTLTVMSRSAPAANLDDHDDTGEGSNQS